MLYIKRVPGIWLGNSKCSLPSPNISLPCPPEQVLQKLSVVMPCLAMMGRGGLQGSCSCSVLGWGKDLEQVGSRREEKILPLPNTSVGKTNRAQRGSQRVLSNRENGLQWGTQIKSMGKPAGQAPILLKWKKYTNKEGESKSDWKGKHVGKAGSWRKLTLC